MINDYGNGKFITPEFIILLKFLEELQHTGHSLGQYDIYDVIYYSNN